MCQNSLARLTYVSLNSLYPFLSEMSPINELRSPKSPETTSHYKSSRSTSTDKIFNPGVTFKATRTEQIQRNP